MFKDWIASELALSSSVNVFEEIVQKLAAEIECSTPWCKKKITGQDSLVAISGVRFEEFFQFLVVYTERLEKKAISRTPFTRTDSLVLYALYRCLKKNCEQTKDMDATRVKEAIIILYRIYNGEITGNFDNDVEIIACKCLRILSIHHFNVIFNQILQRLNAMVKDDDEEIQHSVSTNCLNLQQCDLYNYLKDCWGIWERKKVSKPVLAWTIGKVLRKWVENNTEEYNNYFLKPNQQIIQLSNQWINELSKQGDKGRCRIHIWSLQSILIFLIPATIKCTVSFNSGYKVQGKYTPFMIQVKKVLDANKGQDFDGAVIAAISFCHMVLLLDPSQRTDVIDAFGYFVEKLKTLFANTIKTSALGDVLSEKFLIDIFKIVVIAKADADLTYDLIKDSKNIRSIYVIILRGLLSVDEMTKGSMVEYILEIIARFKIVEKFIKDYVDISVSLQSSGQYNQNSLQTSKQQAKASKKSKNTENESLLFYWMMNLFENFPNAIILEHVIGSECKFVNVVTSLYKFSIFYPAYPIAIKALKVLQSIHKVECITLWHKSSPSITSVIIGFISRELVNRKVSGNYIYSLLCWFCEFFREKYDFFANDENLKDFVSTLDMVNKVENFEYLLYVLSWIDNPGTQKKVIEGFFWLHNEYSFLLKYAQNDIVKNNPLFELLPLFKEICQLDGVAEQNYSDGKFSKNFISLLMAKYEKRSSSQIRAFETAILYFSQFWGMTMKFGINGWNINQIPNIMCPSSGAESNATAAYSIPIVTSFITANLWAINCLQREEYENTIQSYFLMLMDIISLEDRNPRDTIICDMFRNFGEALNPRLHPLLLSTIIRHAQILSMSKSEKSFEHFHSNVLLMLRSMYSSPEERSRIGREVEITELIQVIILPETLVSNFEISPLYREDVVTILYNIFECNKDLIFENQLKTYHQIIEILLRWINTSLNPTKSVTGNPSSNVVSHSRNQDNNKGSAFSVVSSTSKTTEAVGNQLSLCFYEKSSHLLSHLFTEFKLVPAYMARFTVYLNRQEMMNGLFEQLVSFLSYHKTPDFQVFNENIISSMSNLVFANWNVGYEHLIKFINSTQDDYTKHYFISILGRIYEESKSTGSDLSAEQLVNRVKFCDLITYKNSKNSYVIAENVLLKICPLEHIDEMLYLVIDVFTLRNQLQAFLTSLFTMEISKTSDHQTMFRGTDTPVFLLTLSLKIFATRFVNYMVEPIIQYIVENPELNFEIDPHRLSDDDNLNTNKNNLLDIVTRFTKILDFLSQNIPYYVRLIGRSLYEAIQTKFPDKAKSSIVSIIFLRMVNPTLISLLKNYTMEKSNSLSEKHSRTITLFTKLIQNIANRASLIKETYMTPLKTHMEQFIPIMEKFENEIIKFDKEGEPNANTPNKNELFTLANILSTKDTKLFDLASSFSSDRTTAHKINEFIDTIHSISEHTINVVNTKETFYRKTSANSRMTKDTDSTQGSASISPSDFKSKFDSTVAIPCDSKDPKVKTYLLLLAAINLKEITRKEQISKIIESLKIDTNSPYNLVLDFFSFSDTASIELIANHMNGLGSKSDIINNLNQVYVLNVGSKIHNFVQTNYDLFFSLFRVFEWNLIENYDKIRRLVGSNHPPNSISPMYDNKLPIISHRVKYCGQRAVINLCEKGICLLYKKNLPIFNKDPVYACDFVSTKQIKQIYRKNTITLTFAGRGDISYDIVDSNIGLVEKEIPRFFKSHIIKKKGNFFMDMEDQYSSGSCLSVAFLALISEDSKCRTSALKLINTICQANQLGEALSSLHTSDVLLVDKHTDSIINLSDIIARTAPDFSMGFLSVALTQSKALNLNKKKTLMEYLLPWFGNIGILAASKELDRVTLFDTIEKVILVTLSDEESLLEVTLKCWSNIGKDITVSEYFLTILKKVEIHNSSLISNAQGLCRCFAEIGKHQSIIHKSIFEELREAFFGLSISKRDQVSKKCDIDRYNLSLSFIDILSQNRCLIDEQILPKFIVFLLASSFCVTKNYFQAMCSTLMNTLSSITASIADNKDIEVLTNLQYHQTQIADSLKSLYNALNCNDDVFEPRMTNIDILNDHVVSIHKATNSLKNYFKEVSKINTRYSNIIQDLTQTSKNYAFDQNSQIPTCCLFIWSILCDRFDDDCSLELFNLISTNVLSKKIQGIVSAIACFAIIQEKIDKTSLTHFKILWLSISFLQISEPKIYSNALYLCEKALIHIQNNYSHKGDLASVCLSALDELGIEQHYYNLCKTVGINFKEYFYFSLCSVIFKGKFSDAKTKAICLRLFNLLLSFDGKKEENKLTDSKIPYAIALLGQSETAMQLMLPKTVINMDSLKKITLFNQTHLKTLHEIDISQITQTSDLNHSILVLGLLAIKLTEAINSKKYISEILFLVLLYGKKFPPALFYWKNPIITILSKTMIDSIHPMTSYFITSIIDIINECEKNNTGSDINYLALMKFNGYVSFLSDFVEGSVTPHAWFTLGSISKILAKIPDSGIPTSTATNLH